MSFKYFNPTELCRYTTSNFYNPFNNFYNNVVKPINYDFSSTFSWFNSFTPNLNSLSFSSWNSSLFNKKNYFSASNTGVGSHIVNTARKYLGYNEKNGSYKKFTNGRKEAWCADYVTSIVKEAFSSLGKLLPNNFGSSSVRRLVKWAKGVGRYISKTASNITNYVKKGTIIIFGNNSHTGIVTGLRNGRIYTIEGNTSDKVAERSYSINSNYVKGFIQIA